MFDSLHVPESERDDTEMEDAEAEDSEMEGSASGELQNLSDLHFESDMETDIE